MKRFACGVAAAVVICTGLAIGTASPARAECTTQGALALALAQLVDKSIMTAEAAATALSGVGVEPDGGWKLEECLTQAAIDQITAKYAAAVAENRHWGQAGGLASGSVDTALELIRPIDRMYPGNVSPR